MHCALQVYLLNENAHTMPKLLYITMHVRMPTDKAHGLQIVQNCEAFADAGYDVDLWVANRVRGRHLKNVTDIWAHYGIKRNFTLTRIPCIDPMLWFNANLDWWARIAFYVQMVTVLFMLLLRLRSTEADVFYSRDEAIIVLLKLFFPPEKIAYEPHSIRPSKVGIWLQRQATKSAGFIFPVTQGLHDDLIKQGTDANRLTVVHDGIRAERFTDLPTRDASREEIGWDADAFIVGYMGRLHTMGMDKGVGLLVEALAQVEGASLALVGGPDRIAVQIREKWLSLGLPESRFFYAGQVKSGDVPTYLRAFDICAMPFPWTQHFAYYMSPLKVFEYMAVGGAIVASELPAVCEVLTHEETALLHPPSDLDRLVADIMRLRDNPALHQRLGDAARKIALEKYTWAARAQIIVEKINQQTGTGN